MMHVRVATHVPAHPPVYSTLPLSFRACVLDARCRLMAMPFAPGGVVPFPTSTKRAEALGSGNKAHSSRLGSGLPRIAGQVSVHLRQPRTGSQLSGHASNTADAADISLTPELLLRAWHTSHA